MRLALCGLAVVLAVSLLSRFSRADDKSSGASSITGVLIDNACAAKMMHDDDPEKSAAAHTKSCATADSCAASGYAVISGKTLTRFDDHGNDLAKAWLAKTDKKDNLRVVVEGTVNGSQIQVTSLKAAS